jgi:hypothetical protein
VNWRRSGRSRSQEPRRVRSPGSLGVPRPRYSRRRCAPGSLSAPRSVPPRDAGSKSGTGPYPACAASRAPARADDNITVGANPDRSAGPYGSRGAPPRCCCVPATSCDVRYATRRRRHTRRITQKVQLRSNADGSGAHRAYGVRCHAAAAAKPLSVVRVASSVPRGHGTLAFDTDDPAAPHWQTRVEFSPK